MSTLLNKMQFFLNLFILFIFCTAWFSSAWDLACLQPLSEVYQSLHDHAVHVEISTEYNLDKDKMTKHVCCVQWLVWEVSTGNILYRHRRHIPPAVQAAAQPQSSAARHSLSPSVDHRPSPSAVDTMDTVTNVEFSVREYIKVTNGAFNVPWISKCPFLFLIEID